MIGMIGQWLWWDRLWLPGNLTWADLKDEEGLVYARVSHLYVIAPYALVFLLVRYLFERLIATPLAALFGVSEKTRYKVEHNAVLEHYFITKSKNPRQDFKEQIIHHWATLTLLAFSWCGNYIRVGTLVMLIHDSSDILLESAKIFNYAKWERTCNGIFVVFAAVFIVTRLIIFPFWIIHCTWVYPPDYYPPFFGYYFFNFMLVILLMLHIFWAYLILRMVKMFLFGSLTKDERSDNEEDEEEDGETSVTEDNDRHVKVTNGCGGGGANHH